MMPLGACCYTLFILIITKKRPYFDVPDSTSQAIAPLTSSVSPGLVTASQCIFDSTFFNRKTMSMLQQLPSLRNSPTIRQTTFLVASNYLQIILNTLKETEKPIVISCDTRQQWSDTERNYSEK